VVGNPARIVRYRFDADTIEHLLAEKWWDKDIQQIRLELKEYTRAYRPTPSEPVAHVPLSP
jgi:hypothetical protein